MAVRAGLSLRDIEMAQFHPAGLALGRPPAPPATIIEEELRGADGHLLRADGTRFMSDYHPRGRGPGGPVSFNVACAKKSFHGANPRVIASFIAGRDEADALIAASPAEAAKIHLAEESSNADKTLVRVIVGDPASRFTSAPLNITRYADFLAHTGQIRSRPQSWRDLFFAEIHRLPGS